MKPDSILAEPIEQSDVLSSAEHIDELVCGVATLPPGPERQVARERVTGQLMPLARRIAGKFRITGSEDPEDLFQVACLGLVKAIDRYDPHRGHAFLSYAVPTITGEVKRHLRDRSALVRLPRPVQEVRQRVWRAREELQQRTAGNAPTPAQIAEACDLPEEAVREAMRSEGARHPRSLDSSPEGGDTTGPALADLIGDSDPRLDLVVERLSLLHALSRLPTREQHILYLRFFRDQTQQQIAEAVGVSQMHVSRLLKHCLSQLRVGLADPASGFAPEAPEEDAPGPRTQDARPSVNVVGDAAPNARQHRLPRVAVQTPARSLSRHTRPPRRDQGRPLPDTVQRGPSLRGARTRPSPKPRPHTPLRRSMPSLPDHRRDEAPPAVPREPGEDARRAEGDEQPCGRALALGHLELSRRESSWTHMRHGGSPPGPSDSRPAPPTDAPDARPARRPASTRDRRSASDTARTAHTPLRTADPVPSARVLGGPCSLRGYPGVTLLDSDGRRIGGPAEREGRRSGSEGPKALAVTLKPGTSAYAPLHAVADGVTDKPCWRRAAKVQAYPPGSTWALRTPANAFRVCGDVFEVGAVQPGRHP
ncbi:SigB/SigF/SigG family RNA polymerase sigma factor [Streptomyces sp. NPDC096046]|uniref:SigB/SigF/SigG family RNA polymerase sigma factor n=1 Tax=Streptomyces sp. NPDC096046 TaxID=3155542 RepID=UPI003326B374